MSRIQAIQSLIEQDPGNARLRYMLAIETANAGDLGGAMEAFQEVLRLDASYSAAYFHGGQTLEKLGRVEEARAIYRQGIEATRANGDEHTRSELEGALSMLEY